MKTVKIINPMALLLLLAIMLPMTAIGGPRDATEARPLDDQPWGGEIDNGDYRTGSIASVGVEPYPNEFDIISIRNIGTPMAIFDFIKTAIVGYTSSTSSTSIVKTTISADSKTYNRSSRSTKNTRFSIRKGR